MSAILKLLNHSLLSDKTWHVLATFNNYFMEKIPSISLCNLIAVFKSHLSWWAWKKSLFLSKDNEFGNTS